MCNNNMCGGNFCWIIILLLLCFGCGTNGICGGTVNNSCGCGC